MLNRYRKIDKVMHIGGVNYHFGEKFGPGGYYYSKYAHIWGWATWRRAWSKYSLYINANEKEINSIVNKYCQYPNEINFWNLRFNEQINLMGDTWDFQWLYTIWANSGITIYPNYNFVINIGLNDYLATHNTKTIESMQFPSNYEKISFNKKPFFLKTYIWADNINYHRAFGSSINITIWKRVYILYNIIKSMYYISKGKSQLT
jgi:hypothetical protein